MKVINMINTVRRLRGRLRNSILSLIKILYLATPYTFAGYWSGKHECYPHPYVVAVSHMCQLKCTANEKS